jgi:hypothetical protein
MGNLSDNTIKSWRTTIIGILLIGFSFLYMLRKENYNPYLFGFLITSGVVLFITPDKYIGIINKVSERK